MADSVLTRYLNADALSRMAAQKFEPRGLVLGNLAGAHKSPLYGFAVEFAGHREYVPGDDPKHIDWRVFYTRDKYFIKQYEMETNFVCHLILDVSASMRYGDGGQQKLAYAAQMLTTLGYAIIRQSDKVSLATFDDKVLAALNPSNSMAQIERMTERLDEVVPQEKTRMSECLAELCGRMGRREIVMIFSDFFVDPDSLEPVLQLLRFQQHEVVLFHMLHHDEIAFEFGGMVKFTGLESADEFLAQTEDVKQGYLQAFARYERQLDEICRRNRVERVVVDTSHGLPEVFVNYLSSRVALHLGR